MKKLGHPWQPVPVVSCPTEGSTALVPMSRYFVPCDLCFVGCDPQYCIGCHTAKYCSRECQRRAWKQDHKAQCSTLVVERKK